MPQEGAEAGVRQVAKTKSEKILDIQSHEIEFPLKGIHCKDVVRSSWRQTQTQAKY